MLKSTLIWIGLRISMQRFLGKKIILGVCGGVAAYKAVELARSLQQSGAQVQVVMTVAAQDFIGAQTFQAVTGFPVWIDTNDSSFERSMAHIDLSRWADLILVAPATANFMAKIAHGLGDDLLSLVCMMVQKPILVCPAMNVNMWQNGATQANYECLKQRGIIFIGPDAGLQACGDVGFGRMREPEYILNALEVYPTYQLLQGKSFVITAGPTREPIDPVRYISNQSSGLMGFSLAEVLAFAGAKVTLIAGPTHLSCPPGVTCLQVETSQQMRDEVFACLKEGDCFIGVAAVCDFLIAKPQTQKIKKKAGLTLNLEMIAATDILSEVKKSGIAKKVIGFAAETENLVAYAQQKLQQKADMIIANLVGYQRVFGQANSALTVITNDAMLELPEQSKIQLSARLTEIFKVFLQD